MSRLRIYSEADGATPLLETGEHQRIADELGPRGVRFERWRTRTLSAAPTSDEVLAAYRTEIDILKIAGGYTTCDVISLSPGHPDKDTLRQKFLNEHTHSEDEVRFFVAGSGLFTLHIGDRVYEVLCEQGDLIGVPDGTPHWFDMGPAPSFTAIRLFTNPAGWVANFTGSDIAARFPRYVR
jgi:1,2-dihydroxy-3-keto-5-methylthiopentene dioxygenase